MEIDRGCIELGSVLEFENAKLEAFGEKEKMYKVNCNLSFFVDHVNNRIMLVCYGKVMCLSK